MKCPACGRALSQIQVASVTLDVCSGGCGGAWFDKFELQRINEENPVGLTVFNVEKDPEVVVEETSARQCPRCLKENLQRKLFSLGTGVEMDVCDKCGGLWLDHGELESIREETNPRRRPVRAARSAVKKLQIDFAVLQRVEQLAVQQARRVLRR